MSIPNKCEPERMNGPVVSVIIPTFKRKEKLVNCVRSVFSGSYKNLEVIVINDDPNENISHLLSDFPVKCINNSAEKMLVKNRNYGASISTGELLMFLDDDNILCEDTLFQLVKQYLETKNIGMLGPLMLNAKGDLWFWGARINWLRPHPDPVNKKELENELIETDVIPNAYMISRELYLTSGMEDENLLFYEELDLAVRLYKKGYKSYICTKAIDIHDYGNAISHLSSLRLRINFRGMLITERRFANYWQFFAFSFYFTAYLMYYILYKIPKELTEEPKKQYYFSLMSGVKDGLLNTCKFIPYRRGYNDQ